MTFQLNPQLLRDLNQSCDRILNESSLLGVYESGSYCFGLFDGFACWNDTPAGHTANQTCPDYITGFEPNRYAFKQCSEDGSWFISTETNKSWTNYSLCVDMEDLLWQQQVTLVYKTGYSISLVALLISLALFWYFKSLRCARIILHMNLFASFAINNALWLVWYDVINNMSIIIENWISCQILHVVLQYFLLSNYSWMLCEGVYLHTVLVSAFISESKLLFLLNVFGWSVPLCIILPYVIVRICTQNTYNCWMDDSGLSGDILKIPVCFSMVLNLLFLCNIVRVLLVKLKAGPHIQTANGPSRAALQALRATLLLVPLLGMSYLLTPIRPEPGHPLEKTYDIVAAVAASFQGLCVTIFFCFLNTEVVSQVKRKWRNIMFRPRANSCTANTVVSYVAGEDKICLNKSASKKLLQRNLSEQHNNSPANARAINKVNV